MAAKTPSRRLPLADVMRPTLLRTGAGGAPAAPRPGSRARRRPERRLPPPDLTVLVLAVDRPLGGEDQALAAAGAHERVAVRAVRRVGDGQQGLVGGRVPQVGLSAGPAGPE